MWFNISMTSKSTFLIQIASVPGNQVGQRQFEQCRYLHDLLVNTLIDRNEEKDRKEQIKVLSKLVPQHKIVLRSGFSQTAQWGLEPNMFIEIHGDEHQARIISALFGKAFCQDGIGIGGGGVEGQNHSVLTVKKDWNNEDERINFVSMILQHYPSFSAQLDINGQLAFHDYSMQSSSSLNDIIQLINNKNNHEKYFIEERQMKSELVDQTEYENLLMLLESSHMRHTLNILRQAHARLFSGYACASLKLPSISIKHRQKRHEQQQRDKYVKNEILSLSPSHLCSLIFISHQPSICAIINFIIPIIQLSIGFHYIVKNGQDPNKQCEAASDLPLLMAIGGIFALFFLGTAYGFLKMISSINKQQSDVAGKTPKILVGLASFIFGAITFIFFILLQIRVYRAYSNGVQFNSASLFNYCQPAVMRGALAVIILTYINMFLFIGILLFIVINTRNKLEKKKQADLEAVMYPISFRF
ncbi:unnamed protein product [Rotaria sp. Silwood2]|nr:unnamed protein product [Rotaria sp. Silwood2]CAF3891925.1 unnamed protein product [Rotaria sp. Silwood2]